MADKKPKYWLCPICSQIKCEWNTLPPCGVPEKPCSAGFPPTVTGQVYIDMARQDRDTADRSIGIAQISNEDDGEM